MPALDPFSASSRPMKPFDSLPSEPLRFAATLRPIDQNADAGPSSKLPKPKKYKDDIPEVFPLPAYSHSPRASYDMRYLSSALDLSAGGYGKRNEQALIGRDAWMQDRVAQCVDSANGVLDISGQGLETLSTRISDLRDLVTLPPSFSPRASVSSPRFVSAASAYPSSPLLDQPRPPTGSPSALLGANSRSFARVSSAPATTAPFFKSLQVSRPSAGRTPSGLGVRLVEPVRDEEEPSESGPSTPTIGLLSSPPTSPSPGLGRSPRAFTRSKTGAAVLGRGQNGRISNTSLEIMAGRNLLTTLPTALFEISNLTMLSLRGNKLNALPAAIGELVNLKELNISNNHIKELPSTIIHLELTGFHVHPNPLHKRKTDDYPEGVLVEVASTGRILAGLKRTLDQSVPRLYSLCLNKLISPSAPSNLPPLLDSFEWEPPRKGTPHPLHNAAALHEIVREIPEHDLRRVLQAIRSSAHAFDNKRSDKRTGFASLGLGGSSAPKTNPYPRTHVTPAPDDASENPYYYPCPSRRHNEYFEPGSDRPSRHLFIHPAEERLEWRELFGQGKLPIRWKGCSPGCLSFLEVEEEDDGEEVWELDDED